MEQAANELAGARRDQNGVGRGDPFQAAGKLRSLANNSLLIRIVAQETTDHNRTGRNTDTHLQPSDPAEIKSGDRINQRKTGANRKFDVVLICPWVTEQR